jgi:hypothetical protein
MAHQTVIQTGDDVTKYEDTAVSGNDDIDFRLLVVPSPEEQRAIIGELEADGSVDESLHVYTVSTAWHERWRAYVGAPVQQPPSLPPQPIEQPPPPPARRSAAESTKTSSGTSLKTPTAATSSGGFVKSSSTPCCAAGESPAAAASAAKGSAVAVGATVTTAPGGHSKTPLTPAAHPGPIEMDLVEDDNMSVDEKVWIRWVSWYGVSDTHELDRRSWASEERDFEICVLSPYCGLVENAVKTFDVSEETGYAELQLRRVFRVAAHRRTRLWVCEKARHARFQPLLDRSQGLCFQDCVDHNKNYILAIEVADLDGTWPTRVPGEPTGSFDRYRHLVGRRPPTQGWRSTSSSGGGGGSASGGGPFWETELATTLDSVFGGITAALKETATGIVSTVRCMSTQRDAELGEVREALRAKIRQIDERRADVERQLAGLARDEVALAAETDRLRTERAAFDAERQTFAEELVRMHTINKMQDSRVKLNVGGHVFMTSTLTLTKDADSMLAAMFSGRHALRQDDDGAYFIDRDGTHFRYVLNFLRDGNFRPGTLPADVSFLGELCTEAEYYQLAGLVRLLNAHIRAVGGDPDVGGATEGGGGGVGYFSSSPKTVCAVALQGQAAVIGKMAASPAAKRLQRKVSAQAPSPK